MSSKLIGALIFVLLLWVGYRVFTHYREVNRERWEQQQLATGKGVDPAKLTGVPYHLEQSLNTAQSQGAAALKKWLDTYGTQIQDPRKAWIQLDYCKMVFRENPQQARETYSAVRARLKTDSPVYPYMKQLEKAFN